MKEKEYEYLGIRFNISMMTNKKWCCRVPGWYYEDCIGSSSEAIAIAENYIEQNYYKILNS